MGKTKKGLRAKNEGANGGLRHTRPENTMEKKSN